MSLLNTPYAKTFAQYAVAGLVLVPVGAVYGLVTIRFGPQPAAVLLAFIVVGVLAARLLSAPLRRIRVEAQTDELDAAIRPVEPGTFAVDFTSAWLDQARVAQGAISAAAAYQESASRAVESVLAGSKAAEQVVAELATFADDASFLCNEALRRALRRYTTLPHAFASALSGSLRNIMPPLDRITQMATLIEPQPFRRFLESSSALEVTFTELAASLASSTSAVHDALRPHTNASSALGAALSTSFGELATAYELKVQLASMVGGDSRLREPRDEVGGTGREAARQQQISAGASMRKRRGVGIPYHRRGLAA